MLAKSQGFRFSNFDPDLEKVLDTIEGQTATKVSRMTGESVSPSTIRAWRSGKTKRPQNATMSYVLRSAGYTRVIVPIGAAVEIKEPRG